MVRGSGVGDACVDDGCAADQDPIDVPRCGVAQSFGQHVDHARRLQHKLQGGLVAVAVQIAHQHGRCGERQKIMSGSPQLLAALAIVAAI